MEEGRALSARSATARIGCDTTLCQYYRPARGHRALPWPHKRAAARRQSIVWRGAHPAGKLLKYAGCRCVRWLGAKIFWGGRARPAGASSSSQLLAATHYRRSALVLIVPHVRARPNRGSIRKCRLPRSKFNSTALSSENMVLEYHGISGGWTCAVRREYELLLNFS